MTGTAWALLGAVLLGVLQGLTEFLPVSSSGHLVLFQQFIEVPGDDVFFDLMLHLGTLVPALWFYRRDVLGVLADVVGGERPWSERPGVRLAGLVVAASLPTAVIGLSGKDYFELMFQSPGAVSIAFLFTGAVLFATRGRDLGTLNLMSTPYLTAFWIGVAQGVAITPGVSRAGMTIAAAMLLGVEREFAVKLSFLMSVPAILGAVLLKSRDVELASIELGPVLAGALTALVTGYLALTLLVGLVKRGQFSSFCWYVWGMALVAAWVALR
jgi:undecaprenyl-diphosphatase